MQEFAWSKGFTKDMMASIEKKIKRADLMELVKMHQQGIPFDLKDTQKVLDLLEDTKINEEF